MGPILVVVTYSNSNSNSNSNGNSNSNSSSNSNKDQNIFLPSLGTLYLWKQPNMYMQNSCTYICICVYIKTYVTKVRMHIFICATPYLDTLYEPLGLRLQAERGMGFSKTTREFLEMRGP